MPWSPGPPLWGQSPPGTAGSPQGSIPPGSPQPAFLSLQLATKPGLFWSLPSPSGKTGCRSRSSEGHFSPQHFHRICSGGERHRQLDAGNGPAGPHRDSRRVCSARTNFSTVRAEKSASIKERLGAHGCGLTRRKAGAAAPGRAGSQASRQPSTRRRPPPRRALAHPRAAQSRGQPRAERPPAPPPSAPRAPATPPRRSIGHCGRLRELSLAGAESGSAPRGLRNRGRVGGCKGPGVPYITRGSGEVGSWPIPAARSPGRGRSGQEDARASRCKSTAGVRRRGLGAVSQERAGQGAWPARPTGEWNPVSLWHFWVLWPLRLPGPTAVVPRDAMLCSEGSPWVPIVLIFPELAVSSRLPAIGE